MSMAETKTSFFILACYAVVARCCRYLARCYLSKNKSQKHSNNISIRRKFFDSLFLKPPPPPKKPAVDKEKYGAGLWHSWQRGRFRFQRTRVRIRSSSTLLTVCWKTKIKKKRPELLKTQQRWIFVQTFMENKVILFRRSFRLLKVV